MVPVVMSSPKEECDSIYDCSLRIEMFDTTPHLYAT